MADVYTKKKRSLIMARVKNRRTGPEESVALLLRELGVSYKRNVKTLPGQPDFALYGVRLAVFVNGCFWHGHANCSRATIPRTNRAFWERKIGANKSRDRRVRRQLRKQGWRTATIWQCCLRRNNRVKKRLTRLLAQRV